MGELVAIKVFDRGVSRQSPERVRREATLGRSLAHPALVRVFEVIEADGRLALVMEWVAGDSLAERARLGLLPVAEVIRIGEETLAALAYLHSRGVLHRDVKPGNLLLDGSGRVRLADLGLALQLDGPPPPSGSSAGTLSYMSPEQICGHRLTPAADLYALGVTMYQLLTGELPYSGDEETVARGHLSARVPDPSRLRADCPRWLARFVIRLLAKNPEERWPDAEAAAADLHRHTAVDLPRFWRRIASAAAGSALLLAALAASYTTIAPAGGDGGAAMELAELE